MSGSASREKVSVKMRPTYKGIGRGVRASRGDKIVNSVTGGVGVWP